MTARLPHKEYCADAPSDRIFARAIASRGVVCVEVAAEPDASGAHQVILDPPRWHRLAAAVESAPGFARPVAEAPAPRAGVDRAEVQRVIDKAPSFIVSDDARAYLRTGEKPPVRHAEVHGEPTNEEIGAVFKRLHGRATSSCTDAIDLVRHFLRIAPDPAPRKRRVPKREARIGRLLDAAIDHAEPPQCGAEDSIAVANYAQALAALRGSR